jgi:hypothetical protein
LVSSGKRRNRKNINKKTFRVRPGGPEQEIAGGRAPKGDLFDPVLEFSNQMGGDVDNVRRGSPSHTSRCIVKASATLPSPEPIKREVAEEQGELEQSSGQQKI